MDNYQMYEAQADTINVDDIASDTINTFILRRMKRNNADDTNELHIQNECDFDDEEECVDYVPEGSHDMGWLGYFVGKNQHLQRMFIYPFEPLSGLSVRDVLGPFFRGVGHNKSIREIGFFGRIDLLGGENNHNLTAINISSCDFGDEGGRLFSLAIGSSTNKSLRKVELYNNGISEEGMVDIITALSVYPHLKRLCFGRSGLRKNACVALATLLQVSAKVLQYLNLDNNEIDDEGIEALVSALANCSCLRELWISHNPSITTRGWQNLATILEAPNSKLQELCIAQNNIEDVAVTAFANALANNPTLHTLNMNPMSITPVGCQSFSKVICNTSSVNSTFLSNHALWQVGNFANTNTNETVRSLLELNRRDDKKEVAVIKILQNHDDFDMLPFFEWEFNVLPLVISWLERASAYEMPRGFEPKIEPRKLSTIYQFVRGMPLLYVETRLRKELEDIKEELPRLDQRKLLILERRKSIMERLGQR